MTPSPTSRLADERLADKQVHAMCAYLCTGKETCGNCPATIKTPYGDGELSCYGIALETLEKAREILGRADDADEYSPLAYIAAMLGTSVSPRWWCLRPESRAEALYLAQLRVDEWAADERRTAEKYSREDAAMSAQAGGEGE